MSRPPGEADIIVIISTQQQVAAERRATGRDVRGFTDGLYGVRLTADQLGRIDPPILFPHRIRDRIYSWIDQELLCRFNEDATPTVIQRLADAGWQVQSR